MIKKLFLFTPLMLVWAIANSQDAEAPNYANSSTLPIGAAAASKITSNLVNLFTGQASVSIPIYSFKNNSGLAMSVSLEYMGGGIQVGESPTTVGLGWYLSAGGSITRTVRGMPDDVPTNGYLYASAIPQDWRTNSTKYYHDSIDAQQDIFQFNFPGHSGSFFIGKNGQIVVMPSSKIRIIPTYQTATAFNQTLKSFRIVTEDGIKYDFEDADQTTVDIDRTFFPSGYGPTISGYYGLPHATSWNLTRIISPFFADTIKYNYQSNGTQYYSYKLPQVTFVNNANGTRRTPINAPGNGSSQFRKLSSIELPDKTIISFVYSFGIKYNNTDYSLSKIQIKDTAFRFGYLLGYDSTRPYYDGHNWLQLPTRLLLTSITPYTKYEKQSGYTFSYNDVLFPNLGGYQDTIQNKRDFWGFYNAALNGDSLIPKINSYTWGADRHSNANAISNSLSRFSLPSGGYITYSYELNDHYPYTKSINTVSIAAQTSSQNTVTFNQVFNNRHQVRFILDKSFARTGSVPVSGPGNLNVYVKNTTGTITYITTSISLYDLFYSGIQTILFNLDNGSYRLETSLSSGTSITGTLPLDITWENKTVNSSVAYDTSGGIRVSSISKYYSNDGLEGSYEQYKYVLEDGKSSGFLGDIPTYDYPFREVVINGGTTTTDYTVVSSEPLTTNGYVLGSPVGYSRVEIIQNSFSGPLGKVVQEFTDLKDVNTNVFQTVFPFTLQNLKTWGLGLPKRISIYDSAFNLVKRTVNILQFDTINYNNDNFKSLKTGHSLTTFYGDRNNISTPRTPSIIGEPYYLSSGRGYITASYDTIYQSNGSISTSYKLLTYDTNYNVTKVVSSFDRTRGLVREERMYYPYNYIVGGGVGKLRDSSIISLPVSTETWITGDGNPRIIDGLITTFRQIGNNEIKPDTIFSFESNKPIVQASIGVFDSSKSNRNLTYFRPKTYFTSYDSHGNSSEIKSLVTGISNSIITDYDQQYAAAKISNAVQSDIAFTSFEATNSGNWTIGSTQRDLTDKITGKKSYNLSNGNVSKSSLSTAKNYTLTLWAKNTASVSVNGSSLSTSIASQNNWNLFSVSLSGISSITISGSGLIDEVRLHPREANMVTYAFEPLIGTISTTDANNTISYNEYDKLNRLKIIRDKDKNIIKRFDYSDTTMVVSTSPIWQGFDKVCDDVPAGGIDSVYRDINVFSDSSGFVKRVYQGYLDCSCSQISSNPQYKVVNGSCEMGTWGVSSSIYKKVMVDGFLQFRWVCTYRYCFSDGSMSTYYEEQYYLSSCPITCTEN
jgi:hypothetical protein